MVVDGVVADMREVVKGERASTGIPGVDQFADGVMLDEFAAIGSRQAFVDFLEEPPVIINKPFSRTSVSASRPCCVAMRDSFACG